MIKEKKIHQDMLFNILMDLTKLLVGRLLDGELTVHVGHGALGGTFHLHTRSDDGLIVRRGDHCAGDGCLCPGSYRDYHAHKHHCDFPFHKTIYYLVRHYSLFSIRDAFFLACLLPLFMPFVKRVCVICKNLTAKLIKTCKLTSFLS